MLAFLGSFRALEHILSRARCVSLCVSVDYSDVDDTICSLFPEASDADVSPVVVGFCGGVWVGVGVRCGFGCVFGRSVVGVGGCGGGCGGGSAGGAVPVSRNWVDSGFIADAGGS